MDFGHQAVGEGEDLDRVQRRGRGALFHLQAATAAFGQAELMVVGTHPFDQVPADLQRFLEVFARQAEGAGQAGATVLKAARGEQGNHVAQLDQRRGGAE